MIKSMRSLLEQPALKETEENHDDESLNSNDSEDLWDDDNGDDGHCCECHGDENDDIYLDDILDKDEEMNRHAKDLAFLDWFGQEFRPKKHKKHKKQISPLVLNLMNEVQGKGHCRYQELKNQHMRKPGTEHWLVYAKACKAVPPTNMRMMEVQIKGFPETDP